MENLNSIKTATNVYVAVKNYQPYGSVARRNSYNIDLTKPYSEVLKNMAKLKLKNINLTITGEYACTREERIILYSDGRLESRFYSN